MRRNFGFLAVGVLLSLQSFGAPFAVPGPVAPGPQPTVVPTVVPIQCSSSCENDVLLENAWESGGCKPQKAMSCFPYRCDGSKPFCKSNCASDGDCTLGAYCDLKLGACRPGTSCPQKCEYGKSVQTIQEMKNGSCQTKTVIPCFPYSCEATKNTCQQSCLYDSQCAPGATCDPQRKECVPGNRCDPNDDDYVILGAGQRVSCAPYKCNAGACLSSCAVTSQCANGFYCDRGYTNHCFKPE